MVDDKGQVPHYWSGNMQISQRSRGSGSLELSIWIIGKVSLKLCFVKYRNIYRHVYMHGLVCEPRVPRRDNILVENNPLQLGF